jgi:phosphoenolpyruvate carboxykinase (ATP)
MRNMMIRPTGTDLEDYGEPEFTIYNAGACEADLSVEGVTSTTSVAINLEAREMVILGTEYAGEMKKGIFSVMHYLMPLQGVLTLHSGCNMGAKGDVTLFFGLSGTGTFKVTAPFWCGLAFLCSRSSGLSTFMW